MHGICVTEQVMQVAQYLLVCSHEKNAQIIWFFTFQRMNRKKMGRVAGSNEVVNLSVGVTGHILDCRRYSGLFIQAVNRHYREYLANRPGIGQRLKERKIAEIFIR